jgi:hypothetical protein
VIIANTQPSFQRGLCGFILKRQSANKKPRELVSSSLFISTNIIARQPLECKVRFFKFYCMKRILFIGVGTLITLVITVTTAGQSASIKLEYPTARHFQMGSTKENVFIPNYHNEINARAMRHFLTNFAEAANEKWYYTGDMIIVTLTLKGIDYRVDYSKKGRWIETIRTYDETKLSADLTQTVKSSYRDFNISLVQEIEQPPYPIVYIIHLESKTKLIKLQVCNGVVEEWQKFEKSK